MVQIFTALLFVFVKNTRTGYAPRFNCYHLDKKGVGGLMVSALDSGASAPDSSPDRGHCDVFLGMTLTLAVPLSTQVYKWVPANLMLGGVTLRWTSMPSRRE